MRFWLAWIVNTPIWTLLLFYLHLGVVCLFGYDILLPLSSPTSALSSFSISPQSSALTNHGH